MKRTLMIAAALASLAFAAAPSPTQAATSVGISVRIGDPYRGATLRFQSEPEMVMVPQSNVYYVRNYDRDIYRYGRYWYLVDDGYWYQARSYRGPFVRVDFRSVPRNVYSVPTRYRRSWGGSYANRGGRQEWYRDRDRDSNRAGYRSGDNRYRTGDTRYRNDRDVQTRDGNWSRNQNRDGSWSRDQNRTRDNQAQVREQAAREQAAREQAAREQAIRDRAASEQAARDQAARDRDDRDKNDRDKKAKHNGNRGNGRGRGGN